MNLDQSTPRGLVRPEGASFSGAFDEGSITARLFYQAEDALWRFCLYQDGRLATVVLLIPRPGRTAKNSIQHLKHGADETEIKELWRQFRDAVVALMHIDATLGGGVGLQNPYCLQTFRSADVL